MGKLVATAFAISVVADALTTYVGIVFTGAMEWNPLLQFINDVPWAVWLPALALLFTIYIVVKLWNRVDRAVSTALLRLWVAVTAHRVLLVVNNVAVIASWNDVHHVLTFLIPFAYLAIAVAALDVVRTVAQSASFSRSSFTSLPH
jgi:hypothetical protein